MKSLYSIGMALSVAGGLAVAAPLQAQHPVEGIEWMVQNLRDYGQPVIPSFEGWAPLEDGTVNLCFGYFNMNFKEDIEIPLGPNNFIEPRQFDGGQPSFFNRVPPPPHLFRRHFCVFTINVPADFQDKVVWTLIQDGRKYEVPGHTHEPAYQLSEYYQFNQGNDSWPPLVRVVEPAGEEGQGRVPVNAGPVRTRVGQPIPLTVSVALPAQAQGQEYRRGFDELAGLDPAFARDSRRENQPFWWGKWSKYQGPLLGEVTFGERQFGVQDPQGTFSTTATFSRPGTYKLLLQVVDQPGEGGSFQFHCCWTNAFVEVEVAP